MKLLDRRLAAAAREVCGFASDADLEGKNDVRACREAHPHLYVKVVAYDRSLGRQTTALSFIVNRPEHEPGFRLERQEGRDRQIAIRRTDRNVVFSPPNPKELESTVSICRGFAVWGTRSIAVSTVHRPAPESATHPRTRSSS